MEKLQTLKEPRGGRQVAAWEELIRAGEWTAFVRSLLECHYDPVYLRCGGFQPPDSRHSLERVDTEALSRTAAALVAAAV